MSEGDRGILMYESTLSPEARQRLRQIGQADIVIGIPSHRNGRTIGEVVRAISEGIATYLYDQRVVLMIADGGSSDNTVRHIADAAVTPNVEKLINIYEGATGKGTAIRSIFEVTAELQAKAGLVIEARAPGIMPEWLPALLTPILSGDDLAMACYQRSAYASALGDNLMYPFLHTFFGANLRDPLAAEFSLSGAMAADLAGRDVWETDVARFGINIWIAIQSLAENRRMSQVSVGYRGDGSGEPGMPLDARFLHSVGTMFRLLAVHRRLWQHEPAFRQIPMRAAGGDDEHIPCPDCYAELLVAFKEGGERYTNEWRRTLSPATLREIVDAMNGPMEQFDYSPQLWARTVAEFAVIYNQGEGDPDKVAEALLPLFYGRTATYLQRTRNMTPLQREAEITGIVRAFDESKSHLVEKWQSYELWADDGLF